MRSFAAFSRRCSITSTELLVVASWLSSLGLTVLCCAGLVAACAAGCGPRVVLVPEAAPVRIGPETRARIYAMTDGEWQLSANRCDLPEGWYLVPPSFVEEE